MTGPHRPLLRGRALREVDRRLDVYVPLDSNGRPDEALRPVMLRCQACADDPGLRPDVQGRWLGFASWDELFLPGGDDVLPHLYRVQTRATPATLRGPDGQPVDRGSVSLDPRTLPVSERLRGTQRWTCRTCRRWQDYRTETVRARAVKAKRLGSDTAWLPLQERRRT